MNWKSKQENSKDFSSLHWTEWSKFVLRQDIPSLKISQTYACHQAISYFDEI